jgi:hypothetical protein
MASALAVALRHRAVSFSGVVLAAALTSHAAAQTASTPPPVGSATTPSTSAPPPSAAGPAPAPAPPTSAAEPVAPTPPTPPTSTAQPGPVSTEPTPSGAPPVAQEPPPEAPLLSPPSAAGNAAHDGNDANDATMPPAESLTPAAPDTQAIPIVGPPSNLPSYLLWIVGGASLAVGTGFGIAAAVAKHDFDKTPTFDHADAVHNRAIASDVALGLGVVLVVTGTVFYFVKDDSTLEAATQAKAKRRAAGVASLHVTPVIGSHVGGAALDLRF